MNYPISPFDVWDCLYDENLVSDAVAVYLTAKYSTPQTLQQNLLLRLNHGEILAACLKLVDMGLVTSYSVSVLSKQWVKLPELPVSEAQNLLENIGVNSTQRILLEMLKLNPQKRIYQSIDAIAPPSATTPEFHAGLAANQYQTPIYSNSGVLQRKEKGFWNLSFSGLDISWSAPIQRNLTQQELLGLFQRELIKLPAYLFLVGRITGQAAPVTTTSLQQVWEVPPLEAAKSLVALGNTNSGLSPDFWNGVAVSWSNFEGLTQEQYAQTKSMFRAHGLFLQQLRLENQSGLSSQGVDLAYYQQKYYPIENPTAYELRKARNQIVLHLCKLQELGLLTFSYSSFRIVQT